MLNDPGFGRRRDDGPESLAQNLQQRSLHTTTFDSGCRLTDLHIRPGGNIKTVIKDQKVEKPGHRTSLA